MCMHHCSWLYVQALFPLALSLTHSGFIGHSEWLLIWAHLELLRKILLRLRVCKPWCEMGGSIFELTSLITNLQWTVADKMVHVSPCTIPEKPDTSRKGVMVLHYLTAMPDTEDMSLKDWRFYMDREDSHCTLWKLAMSECFLKNVLPILQRSTNVLDEGMVSHRACSYISVLWVTDCAVRQFRLFGNWTLMSCQPHRVTSGQRQFWADLDKTKDLRKGAANFFISLNEKLTGRHHHQKSKDLSEVISEKKKKRH